MSHRERHTSDEAVPLADRAGLALTHAPPSNGSLWDEWYPRASPAQRQEALARAARQGVVFAHELAVPAQSAVPNRSLLSTLLNGQAHALLPFQPLALELHDPELDENQREAAARAVATPDVFLIQGFPGTGKSRLIAEIVLQAAERGERIVFLAANPAAVDSVLERVGEHASVCPVRCLAADERPAELSPAVARLTLPERLRDYREKTLPAARAAREAARKNLEARAGEQGLWPQLEESAGQCEQMDEHLRSLQQARVSLESDELEWDRADAPLRSRHQQCQRGLSEALERLDNRLAGALAELETTERKQAQLEKECAALRPLIESRQGRRIWTVSWWRSVMQGGLHERMRDLETRRADMQAAKQRLERDIAAQRLERVEIETRYSVELQSLCDEERCRRRSLLDGEIAAASQQLTVAVERGQALSRTLPQAAVPAKMSRDAVRSAHQVWQRLHDEQKGQADAAELWLRTVEEGERTLPRKLADCANLVAATTAGLTADPQFGDRNGVPSPLFDLLILEEAHQITEAEFAAAARRARRWVLIGESRLDAERRIPVRKEARSSVPRPSFFERLWQHLHADPRRLPFAWTRHDGRLHCRLRDCSADDEKWIETETVVDRPDIALRILTLPRQTPRLVDIHFPMDMNVAEAKQFLFNEMEELAVQTRGQALRWSESPTEIVLGLDDGDAFEITTIDLAQGVSECLARTRTRRGPEGGFDWHTRSLAFAVAEGWTRQRAEDWIGERLGMRALGRTIRLTAQHRLDPPLAHFLSDLLFDGSCPPAKTETVVSWPLRAVEFIAVPPLALGDNRHSTHAEARGRGEAEASSAVGVSVRAPRLRTLKGGAGLEIELSDRRPLDQLPADLRAHLPPQGLVNYLEARALVQYLDVLMRDDNFLTACAGWPQRRGASSSSGRNGSAVAIVALYTAQVELLRQMLRKTSLLAHPVVSIDIGLPSAFAQRECLLALVSLTRSHTHRAVPYGENPQALTQALTRAASGLILFGDPGTLARRSQWRGPLDHLDDDSARSEGRIATRLVQYLQGRGNHPSAFLVQEGSGV